jgi:multicomponent Na+:H+ antiporter subunit F
MNASTVIAIMAAIALVAAALLTMIRIARGPTGLDRAVAADVIVAIVVAGLALEAGVNRHTTTLPILVALSLLGFIGSLTLARATRDRYPSVWERPSTDVADDSADHEARGRS